MDTLTKKFIITWGFIEALVFSGCLFGWPSLLLVLQEEGIYGYLCEAPFENDSFANKNQEPIVLITTETEINVSFHGQLLKTLGHTETAWNASETPLLSLIKESQDDNESKIAGCTEQRIQMTLVYTFAAVAYGITAIFIGISLEVLGLRITRLAGSALLFSGFMFLAFTTPDRSWFLWPALNLIALGSNQLRLSGFQFADLLPKYRATILTSYSSAYAVSTTFFVLMQIIYEKMVSLHLIFIGCAVTSALTFIPTFFMPRDRIVEDAKPVELERNGHTSDASIPMVRVPGGFTKKSDCIRVNNNNEEGERNRVERRKGYLQTLQAIRPSLLCWSGLFHLYWHFINLFLVLFYSSTFNIWVAKVTSSMSEVSFFVKMSGICSLLAPIFIPLTGFFTDRLINKARNRRTPVEQLAYTMQAPTFSMTGATILLALTIASKMFITKTAVYLSMVLIALARPAIIGSCTAYIRHRFPADHFNVLNGVFTTIISILAFLQYPVMRWMTYSDKSYSQAHWLLIIVLLFSLVSPFHMMIRSNIMTYARRRLTVESSR